MMSPLDFIALCIYAFLLISIGIWGYSKVKNANDFYIGGGKVPWWLSGVSHHVSGYSAVIFTGYATIAYRNGISIYFWWALSIALMLILGSYLIAPRWARLRKELNIQSPTTYLATRYGLPTQQLIAWSGVLLKLLDVAAKWVAIAVILKAFVGIDLTTGILIGSSISLLYISFGGFWADLANDFFQFILQLVAGLVMFFAVLNHFEGWGGFVEAWQTLPAANRNPLNEPYDIWYTIFFAIVLFMSYNGGTWNLAMRFMASPDARSAQKTARLSAILYIIWPVILFMPMWISPVIFPGLGDEAGTVYALLAEKFIPAGLYGLVLGGMIAATLTMTASDTNAISAVITQDVLPVLFPKKFERKSTTLKAARITTALFMAVTIVIALNHESFGGIIGLIITWFGALLGPSAMPLLLGLLPIYKKCDQTAAITTMIVGFAVFALFKFLPVPYSLAVGGPSLASLFTFSLFAVLNRNKTCRPEVEQLVNTASGISLKS